MPVFRIAPLIQAAAKRLAGFPNPGLDAEMLFLSASGMSRAAALAQGNEPAPEAVVEAFEDFVTRREGHEPIQYIVGTASFWRDEFIVTPSVLIPRPDTEILVEAVATRLRHLPAPRVLDIGTGSGCVALSLLRELPGALASGLDVSEAALEVARRNAEQLGLRARIDLRRSCWLDELSPTESFDAIVSNPPYVAKADEAALSREVREHEPALALFAEPEDDLSSYRAILGGLRDHLAPSGLLAFEVGAGQASRVAALLSEADFQKVEVLDDLARIPRVVLGRR